MPSPLYLLSHRVDLENVPVGNMTAEHRVELTFHAIDPKSAKNDRPTLTMEGDIRITFFGPPVSSLSAEAQAEDFELGKFYRIVPVEELPLE